jgi:hypothetical protein
MSVQRKHTCEDLLALGNILHGSVVDVAGLRHGHLLWTTWWMGDVALSGILLWHEALSSEVARAATVEVGVSGGGPSRGWCRYVLHNGGGGRGLGATGWCGR